MTMPFVGGHRFFHDGRSLRRGRVLCALRKIRAIANFFSDQDIFRFYASSLLFTYDSADPPMSGNGSVEEEVEVRMIDFAHAVPADVDLEAGGEGKVEAVEKPADKGYLYGVRNVSPRNVYGFCIDGRRWMVGDDNVLVKAKWGLLYSWSRTRCI